MNLLQRLEAFLQTSDGKTIPPIRYFDGTDMYSDKDGNYAAETLEESLELFLKANEPR